MSRTNDVHLLVECNFAAPVRRLMDHTKRKPSLISPNVARYCELALNARLRTPIECSVMIVSGTSREASLAVEKIRTRGLYPV